MGTVTALTSTALVRATAPTAVAALGPRARSRVLVLWCPDWPAVAALRQAELSADLPAVVLAAGRVRVATAAARGLGIAAGMRRRDAVSRCPNLRVLSDDPGRDARLFEPIAEAVEEVVPGIEVLRPGLIACSIRGPARYFGSEHAAAERVVDVVEAFDVECRVGIAAGLQIAVLAARQSTIVPESVADAAFCATLPLTELGREPAIAPPEWGELIGLLLRLGIVTAGDLAALPIEKVATRFGSDGVDLHRLASGRAERDLSRRRIVADIAVTQRCDPPLERVDTAAFLARSLAQQFHLRLAAAGLACTRLAVTATTEHGETLTRIWRCARPLDAAGTADRLRWQLDGWLTATSRLDRLDRPHRLDRLDRSGRAVRRGAITALRLEVAEAIDAGRIQYGLWGSEGLGAHRAGWAFARVQGLLGIAAVTAVMRRGGRGPDDRIALTPWGEVGRPDRDPDGPWPGALPAPAPAHLGSGPPEGPRVEVCDGSGEPVDLTDRGMLTGRPAFVAGRPVTSWAGPWLLDERWWAAARERRARLQVVTDPGPPVLLELDSRGWLVEAVYD